MHKESVSGIRVRPILISQGCYNQLAQTWPLKKTKLFSHSSGDQRPSSGCLYGNGHSENWRESVPCLNFQMENLELKSIIVELKISLDGHNDKCEPGKERSQ